MARTSHDRSLDDVTKEHTMTKKLGFGCMRLPLIDKDDQTSIDLPQVERMVDMFLDRGFTYFDTAWMYHAFESENAVRKALVERHPRDSFTVATKMPTMMLKDEADHQRIFDEQRRKVGVDHFDYYLLHNINGSTWETARRLGTFEFVAGLHDAGDVTHMGFSFHDSPDLLDEVLTAHPEVEFVQLQINYLDWDDAGIQSRRCYETAVAHGKKVVVMEPVKGGTLANPPEDAARLIEGLGAGASPASWAVRFCASLPEVMMVLSGMSSMEQLEDNTGYMRDFAPLTEEETNTLLRAARLIRSDTAVPCTSCRYCVAGCPKQIPIPTYFGLYNSHMRDPGSAHSKMYYANITKHAPKASDCIGCRRCVKACPQHIMVPEMLADVAKAFEAE
jgi:predicted aldo/keto reductase-like oxidoreductase